jgi:predicted  nucleic acid-binding Zn-ribbon protein
MNKNPVELQLGIIELEHQIDSVKERIRDIEWRLEHDEPDVSPDSRQKALDKLRFLSREITDLRKQLLQCKKD